MTPPASVPSFMFLAMIAGEPGHFQGGVKLPLRRSAEPLKGALPPPSNSPGGGASKTCPD